MFVVRFYCSQTDTFVVVGPFADEQAANDWFTSHAQTAMPVHTAVTVELAECCPPEEFKIQMVINSIEDN